MPADISARCAHGRADRRQVFGVAREGERSVEQVQPQVVCGEVVWAGIIGYSLIMAREQVEVVGLAGVRYRV